MGYWKNRAGEQEGEYNWARELLCEVKAFRQCDVHGTYFDGPNDVADAYKLANARISSGELKLDEGQTRHDITDLIKAVYDDNSALSKCPVCQKNFERD